MLSNNVQKKLFLLISGCFCLVLLFQFTRFCHNRNPARRTIKKIGHAADKFNGSTNLFYVTMQSTKNEEVLKTDDSKLPLLDVITKPDGEEVDIEDDPYPIYNGDSSVYGDEGCPSNGDKNILAKLFEKWVEIAKTERIEYFLTCGTLLGSYRNADFIPYDSDLDILINRSDFPKISKYDTRKPFRGMERDIFVFVQRDFYLPYEKRRRFSCRGKRVPAYMDHCSFQEPLGRLITENRHLDIYDYQKKGTKLWDPSEGGRTFHESEVFPLRKCYLMNYEAKCPNRPIEFLGKFYGKNLAPLKVCENGVWVTRNL